MKKFPWFWIVICALAAIVVIVGWKQFTESTSPSKMITEQKAILLVQERFQGEVTNFEMKDSHYLIELKKQNNLYHINMDIKSGKVLSIAAKQLSTEKDPKQTNNEQPEEEIPPPDSEQQPKSLSNEEAIQIALNQVQGEVDSIVLETKDGQTYYLVEVETPNDQEAVVQVHAITGEVMSVTWDDHDDDD
ncbi:PepSY domain-containing protein [Bacillus sp. MRMR6]|uniref:PepSY domain-containing protein n=1 Tax=Bacillus sp. MRMR6 TaxID=1928617 RepID=UPI000950EDAF|nr:PepSY domain-containing protein [Bacillus sp. MRMR6]OLS41858.1 hypothetical protein BTR25_00360 [Bacillus sp. MRMR6]